MGRAGMKPTLYLRVAMLLMLVAVALFGLVACSAKTDVGEADDLTKALLDCVLAEDDDGAYALFMKEYVSPEDFATVRSALKNVSEGAFGYELEQIGWRVNSANGLTTRSAAFEISFDNGKELFVRTTVIEGQTAIGGILLHETTAFKAAYGDTARVANVILIVVSALGAAFTIWMIVDCARRRMAKKPLWIVLILLGVTLNVTFGQTSGLSLGMGFFLMLSGAVADPSILSVAAKLIVPVGALIYFFLRKRLTLTPPSESEEQSEDVAEPKPSGEEV